MTQGNLLKEKGPFEAVVISNERTGGRFYRLNLQFDGPAAKAFANATPGQFAQLDLASLPVPQPESIPDNLRNSSKRAILLRRPFSFSSIITEGDKTIVTMLYCVLGPATLRMSTLTPGQSVNIIGPLGNGFNISSDKKEAVLTAGGMGVTPIRHLAEYLDKNFPNIKLTILVGAKNKEELCFDKDSFADCRAETIIATDDGSVGLKGLVTAHLERRLDKTKTPAEKIIIYTCGPEQMLAAVANIARQRNLDCQVSMERVMACGINLCQSCAIECKKDNSNETFYKMCCKEGPVFDSKEVVFKI